MGNTVRNEFIGASELMAWWYLKSLNLPRTWSNDASQLAEECNLQLRNILDGTSRYSPVLARARNLNMLGPANAETFKKYAAVDRV